MNIIQFWSFNKQRWAAARKKNNFKALLSSSTGMYCTILTTCTVNKRWLLLLKNFSIFKAENELVIRFVVFKIADKIIFLMASVSHCLTKDKTWSFYAILFTLAAELFLQFLRVDLQRPRGLCWKKAFSKKKTVKLLRFYWPWIANWITMYTSKLAILA